MKKDLVENLLNGFLLSSLSLLFLASNAQAMTLEIIGPCSAKPLFTTKKANVDLGKTVGQLTLETFRNHQIPFVGDEKSIVSIYKTPTGLDAMEVIDDRRMRAYGWCYKINGILPGSYMDQVYLENEQDRIQWFYGYSFYDSGEWKGYCEEAFEIAPAFLCSQN